MRPDRLIAVTATGTDIGKTWVAARLAEIALHNGLRVAARKPAQSFDPRRHPLVVHVNRYDPDNELHRLNMRWLAERDGLAVTSNLDDLYRIVDGQVPQAHM